MSNEAIQQDAEEQKQQDANDPIEAIAAKVEAQRGQAGKEGDVNDIDAQLAASGVSLIDNPDNYRVKVKLEGQEEELTLTEVLRGFQKESVATRRLNEATRLLREAEDKAMAAAGGQHGADADDDAADGKKEAAKKAIDALMEGDEEAAAEALAELAGGREATQLPGTNEVAAAVKQQLEVESALTAFQESYGDVLADPHLASMTNDHLKAELDGGEHADYASALKAAGNRTRDWLKQIGAGGGTATGSTTENNVRVALKEGMEQIPSMSASAGTQAEQAQTASDIIAEMRAERGLA